jgi:ABC-type multidrug transport system fused ATPase/permease subunit
MAHRLSTIAYADRIVVLAGGKIVEEGRHKDLLARRKAYYKLYRLQFSGASEPVD